MVRWLDLMGPSARGSFMLASSPHAFGLCGLDLPFYCLWGSVFFCIFLWVCGLVV